MKTFSVKSGRTTVYHTQRTVGEDTDYTFIVLTPKGRYAYISTDVHIAVPRGPEWSWPSKSTISRHRAIIDYYIAHALDRGLFS